MTYILVICILLSFVAGGFVAYKGVQLGLRWQVEVRQERPPTMDSPVKTVVEQVTQGKQEDEAKNLVSEWLNGAEESR